MNWLRLRMGLPLIMMEGDKGGGGGADDIVDPPAGGDEFVTIKDPVTNEDVKVPKDLQSLFNHSVSGTRTATQNKMKEEYGGILSEVELKLKTKETENEDILAQLQEIRERDMSAEEKAQEQLKVRLKEYDSKIETSNKEALKWKDMYYTDRKYRDIHGSFTGVNLCNPDQVAQLMENEGRADIREIMDSSGNATGNYETILTLNIENKDGEVVEMVGNPKELFKPWILQKKNSHHISNDLSSGGGTKFNNVGITDGVDLSKMNPTERLKYARNQPKQ